MKTIKELLPLSIEYLSKRKVPIARRSSEEIFAHILGLKRIELYMNFDRPIEEKEVIKIRALLKRRMNREPLEYILGIVEFYHSEINIDPSVLIPRPETEIMVDLIKKKLEKCDLAGKTLWDICTGSGCIAIALKKAFPDLNVVMSDFSEEALKLAKSNAMQNGVKILAKKGDLLTCFSKEKADFVVCNPPYVSEVEYESLEPEISYEPKDALIAGKTGLEFYQKLAKDLPGHLSAKSKVFLEIGKGQGSKIKEIFSEVFEEESSKKLGSAKILLDLAGHDRFFFLEIE